MTEDINENCEEIKRYIIQVSSEFILENLLILKKKCVPWWNSEYQAIIKKDRALTYYKNYPTAENLMFYKKTYAQARRVVHGVS